MRKLVSLLLVISLVFVVFAMAACDNTATSDDTGDGSGAGTNAPADSNESAGTDADTEEPADPDTDAETDPVETKDPNADPEPNMYPYSGDIIPYSISIWEATPEYQWGAPDATSIFLPVDPENVIHDGKGTWENHTDSIATMCFDMDERTFYDCDENCGTENNEDMNYAMYDFDNWDGDTTKTGYVGAYFEQGVYLTQIRWFGRAGDGANRNEGGYFEASADGETWTTIYTIEANSLCADFEFADIPEEFRTVAYKYVRYVGPDEGYCNMAELEFWGSYAS